MKWVNSLSFMRSIGKLRKTFTSLTLRDKGEKGVDSPYESTTDSRFVFRLLAGLVWGDDGDGAERPAGGRSQPRSSDSVFGGSGENRERSVADREGLGPGRAI